MQDKKAAKERDREERIAQAEADNVHSVRNVEAENLKKVLDKYHLAIKEVKFMGQQDIKYTKHKIVFIGKHPDKKSWVEWELFESVYMFSNVPSQASSLQCHITRHASST